MRIGAAKKMIERVCGVASAKDVPRATRATLFRVIGEEKSNRSACDLLSGAVDRPWATKDLTRREVALENLERLTAGGGREVEAGEVIACFPTLARSEEIEPVVIIAMPGYMRGIGRTVMRDEREALRRRIRAGEQVPGLREEAEGFYLDTYGAMRKLASAAFEITEENIKSRLGLASLFLGMGYRVAIAVPGNECNLETLPLAIEGAQALRQNGAEIVEVGELDCKFGFYLDWPRDIFTQFEYRVYTPLDGLKFMQYLGAVIGLTCEVKASRIGEGGRAVKTGEGLAYGAESLEEVFSFDDPDIKALVRGVTGRDLDSYRKDPALLKRLRDPDKNARGVYESLGFNRTVSIEPYWFDFYTPGQLEFFGFTRRVFMKNHHVDKSILPIDASHELSVHARFYAQRKDLIDQLVASSGYALRIFPDRPCLVCNGLPLERGPYDLLLDKDSEPERALLSPQLRVVTTEESFADAQRGDGGIRCATNILWVRRAV